MWRFLWRGEDVQELGILVVGFKYFTKRKAYEQSYFTNRDKVDNLQSYCCHRCHVWTQFCVVIDDNWYNCLFCNMWKQSAWKLKYVRSTLSFKLEPSLCISCIAWHHIWLLWESNWEIYQEVTSSQFNEGPPSIWIALEKSQNQLQILGTVFPVTRRCQIKVQFESGAKIKFLSALF